MIMVFKNMKNFLLFLSIFIFVGCAEKSINLEENYKIYQKNELISFDNLIQKICKFDIILIGEKHEEISQIQIASKIITSLKNCQNKNIDLILEMIYSDKNEILQNNKIYSEKWLKDKEILPQSWEFDIYKNIIKVGFDSKINLKGANLNKAEISQIFAGAMPLYGKISTTKQIKQEIAKVIKEFHEIDENRLEKMVQIQQFRDRRMAEILVKSKNLAILYAGNFHIDKKLSVPIHIKEFKSGKKFVCISLNGDKNADFYFIGEK